MSNGNKKIKIFLSAMPTPQQQQQLEAKNALYTTINWEQW